MVGCSNQEGALYLSRNPVIFNILTIGAVTLALHLVGAPASLYKGFVSVHMALLAICGISGFLVSIFESYQHVFQPWKRLLLVFVSFIFLVAAFVAFIGWPAFGAIYALYFWLST